MSRKVSDEPRLLEDEGLYVNKKLKVLNSHKNVIEERLLGVDDKSWFDCQGNLKMLENPIVNTSFRPEKQTSRKETIVFKPAVIDQTEVQEIVVVRDNILSLKICELKFSHHPLFSIEHVFEQRLLHYLDEYQKIKQNNLLERTQQRLEALRHVKNSILMRQLEDQPQNDNKIDQEIKSLKDMLFDHGKKNRTNLKNILQCWKAIKQIRNQNNYCNTSIKLIIHKEKVEYQKEKDLMDKYIEDTTNEILQECKQEFRKKKRLYRKELREWEETHQTDDNESQEGPMEPIYDAVEEKIKTEIQKKFKESFKPPGEPILTFCITNDNKVTKTVEDSNETMRRSTVTSTKIYLRVICNKIEVCKSKPITLDDTFACSFLENFSIQLINIPKLIQIEIIEQTRSLLKRKLGDVEINIPSLHVSRDSNKILEQSFEKPDLIHYKHEATGSGKLISDFTDKYNINTDFNKFKINTSGKMYYQIYWEKTQQNSNESPSQNFEHNILNEVVNKNYVIDMIKLSNWMKFDQLDPQDPRNTILYEYVTEKKYQGPLISNKNINYFRLNPHAEKNKFCDMKIIEENLRLKLLVLRNQNVPEFDGMVIPVRTKEIPFNILADYERRISIKHEDFGTEERYDDDLEDKQNFGIKYLKQIHIIVFQRCKNIENHLTYEDVVDEKILHHFQKIIFVIMENLVNWFRWQPKIKKFLPESRQKSTTTKKIYTGVETKILIEISSGINIPARNNNTRNDNGVVQPFIEASFNNIKERTSTASGENPVWKELLSIPLESMNVDYLNPNSLTGLITICLFDEIESSSMNPNENNENKSKNLLGFLEIPLAAATNINKIEGMFRLKTPYVLFGYKKKLEENPSKSANIQNPQSLSPFHTYLSMKISVVPNLPKLHPSMDELPSNDLLYITRHVLKWNENYNESFPSRKFSALAIDTTGKTVCVVRYIKPLEPPQINTDRFDVTPDQCARYISLIPFTKNNEFYQNVWLPTDKFLQIRIGTTIDHAVALTCFMLALRLEAWLLLGYGIPHGSSAYVLIKDFSKELPSYYVYDVVYGEKYNLSDPFCPLQKVYCLINKKNIFANVQRGDNISMMRFDLTRRSDWNILFNNKIGLPMNSIQNKLSYRPPTDFNMVEIQIDKKIKKIISKMRQMNATIWNREVSNHFKKLLHTFELNCMYGKSNFEITSDLQQTFGTKMQGFVLNLPYAEVSSVIKNIKLMGCHNHNNPESTTEFASAVRIFSYPNEVCVVWVLIAVLLKD